MDSFLKNNEIKFEISKNEEHEKNRVITITTQNSDLYDELKNFFEKTEIIQLEEITKPIFLFSYEVDKKYNQEIEEKIELEKKLLECCKTLSDNGLRVERQNAIQYIPISYLKKTASRVNSNFCIQLTVDKKSDVYIRLIEYNNFRLIEKKPHPPSSGGMISVSNCVNGVGCTTVRTSYT
jgi:hypothetical protein